MRTIEDLVAEMPAFASLAPEHGAVIAGCGGNAAFHEGDFLMREGEPADVFYVIRNGAVALETFVPQRGAVTLQSLHDGDLLGWSWLVAPYRVAFDARALSTTHTLAFDAACLRGKCEQDPALGYDLFKVFAAVIVQRLQHTRVQLLDVYGTAAGS
jgi:CRP-like cAMP-binding protein